MLVESDGNIRLDPNSHLDLQTRECCLEFPKPEKKKPEVEFIFPSFPLQPVINVFPVPDAAGLMFVTLGQLEIREVR